MAGIFGYYQKKLKSREILNKFYLHSKLEFNYQSNFEVIQNGEVGLGFSAPYLSNKWPIMSKNSRYFFQLFGEIYLLDNKLLDSSNFDDHFLYQFLSAPSEMLLNIDGSFIFALYDKIDKEFTICNDPFGNFALYYFNKNNELFFSTQLHSITDIIGEQKFDKDGISEYLGIGFPLNGKTYYKNIKKLQAGEILKFSLLSTSVNKYFHPTYNNNTNNNSNDNFEKIKESLISSVNKRIINYSSVGAAITGGYDSRVTWSIINYLSKSNQVIAFTHGLETSRDMQIAKKIANKLKLNHKTKLFDLNFIKELPNDWELFTKLTEGLIPISGAHAIKSWQFGQEFYDVILDSQGGALYRRQFMKVSEKLINFSSYIPSQFFKLIKSSLFNLKVLNPEAEKAIIESSIRGLDEYFSAQSNVDLTANLIDKFYLEQVLGNRYSAASNAQMNWVILSHPFLNIDTFNLLKHISIKERANQEIYKYIVDQTSPVMKKFHLENMGMPAPYYGFTILRYIPMVYELLINKSIGRFSMAHYKQLSLRKFVTNYDDFFRINFDHIKEILLRPNTVFNEFINIKQLEKLIVFAKCNNTYRMSLWSDILTFKLFLDVFH